MRKDLVNNAMRMSGLNYYNMMDNLKFSAIDNISMFIKTRYGEEIYMADSDRGDVRGIANWLKQYYKKFSNLPKDNTGKLIDCQFIVKLDSNTFAFVQVGKYINSFSFNVFDKLNRKESGDSSIKMYIFGRHYKKFVKELNDSVSLKNTGSLYIYDVKGTGPDTEYGIDSVGRVMTRRDIDTLFFNDHIKETICNHIDNFFVNKEIYESKNLTYKTGILLYGDPGTGKTSLSQALASKYNYNLIVIDMATFDLLNVSTLTSCINADSDKYIILLEDIDTIYNNLDRKKAEDL